MDISGSFRRKDFNTTSPEIWAGFLLLKFAKERMIFIKYDRK